MNNLFKILTLVFIILSHSLYAQNTASASSMESGYWNYKMNQYEADSYSLNKKQTVLIRKSDSLWNEMDSIWRKLKSSYQTGHNFKTTSIATTNERYYIYVTDSTIELTDLNLSNTADRVCFLQISFSGEMVYCINEVYNASCGLYYMSGDTNEILCKLMTILKKASN